ncbi:2-aminoadipate aminotransferase [Leucobacter sp. Psy1]|uniref:aminotransferase-like domain-containing protein n=1 Tax=Leucobacter sp. Psy1 TaxID=2875729 RepID=UPI001CD3612F|nr:PLP-dependent aminotransferase family protein [Leucobacter sp. Psy1]UBH04713.1 2-aminoadipate aminotransferase [Leucobacter sp. Psy1]
MNQTLTDIDADLDADPTSEVAPHPRTRPALVAALSAPQGFGDQTLRSPRPDAIELLGGIPDPSVLPASELAEATTRVLSRPGSPALQYSRAEGLPQLREWIAAREGVAPERILITNGGFHGLSLAVQAVVERGDLVAVDNPVFPLFLRGLQLSAARTLPIPVGPQGLDVARLAEELRGGARPSALYTVPDFHNPAQSVLPEAERRELVRLAERYGFVVIADNPYRELRFSGEQVTTAPFYESDHVIEVGTFTKTLGPGLRLGWVVLPERFRDDVIALRSRADGHSSTLVQAIVAELVTGDPGLFDRVLNRARALYRDRATVLANALESAAPGAFDIEDPEGGLFLWPRLRDERIDPERLAEDASATGVEYQRGSFFPSGPGTDADRHLRLSYGDNDADRLREAAARLGRAIAAQPR